MLDELLDRLRQHDRLALSRLLSLIARGQVGAEIVARLPGPARPGRVVAFTGSGGVGKSSLIGGLIELIRRQGRTVAVLACDPQSALTGGALLGDRFRMGSTIDDGIFIRSLAAVSGRGAVADHLPLLCRALAAFGFDFIFLETVGAGQGDVAVRDVADVVILLLQPQTGDDLQWEKAGVLEVADLIVVHKADLPGADETIAQVRAALGLSHQHSLPVLAVSAKTGQGLEELWQVIQASPRHRPVVSSLDLLHLAQEILAERWQSRRNDPDVARLSRNWEEGKLASHEAAASLIDLLNADLRRM